MSGKPRLGKLVAFNAVLVVALLVALNLVAALILDLSRAWELNVLPSDKRAGLPNYPDKQLSRQILGEFNQLQTRYVPFVEWRRAPYHGKTTTVDADGYRVMPDATPSPAGTVRFFGGSAMWGTGVPDDQTIPAWFNKLEPQLRVLNHAESGFSTRQDVAQLVNLVNQAAPTDVVVFYDGNNDAVTYCRYDVGINGHVHASKMARLLRPPSWIWNALTGSLQELLSGKAVRQLLHSGPYATRCHESPEYAQLVAATMVNNWKIAHAIARDAGADFVAILQPVASQGSPRVDHLKPADYSPQNEQNIVYPIVRRLLKESGIDWAYDFTDIFDGDNDYTYIDVCHVTAGGNKRIAGRIDTILAPRLRQIAAGRAGRIGVDNASPAAVAPASPSQGGARR